MLQVSIFSLIFLIFLNLINDLTKYFWSFVYEFINIYIIIMHIYIPNKNNQDNYSSVIGK